MKSAISRRTKRAWKPEELATLTALYPGTPTGEIAVQLGRSIPQVYQAAARLGLHKTAAYLASPAACRLRRDATPASIATRFKPGNASWNKGVKYPKGYAPGRMAEGQFIKGQRPHTWLPIGSMRISKDGYQQRKVSDTGYPPRDWKGVHILLWEEAHGPVPPGHAVTFKDRDKANITLGNLELLSRRELMARNTVHQLPKELVELVHLRGVLNRKIRSLSEKQDVRPA